MEISATHELQKIESCLLVKALFASPLSRAASILSFSGTGSRLRPPSSGDGTEEGGVDVDAADDEEGSFMFFFFKVTFFCSASSASFFYTEVLTIDRSMNDVTTQHMKYRTNML